MTRMGKALVVVLLAPMPALAQGHDAPQDSVEAHARRARRGAGLRVGTWQVTGLSTTSGATYSTMPVLEGYFQKGLDRHIAIESSVGIWRRGVKTSSGENNSILVPILTSLKLFPTTGPDQQLEPFIMAGVGFTIGVNSGSGAGTGGLPFLGGGSTSSGTLMIAGIGGKGGVGFEYRFSQAFGINGSVGYQYVYFGDPVGGDQTYKGVQGFGGLTYRFQY